MKNDKPSAKCPLCGSRDVSKPQFSRRAFAISFLLLGFPLPFLNKTQHCFDCGTDYKKPKGKMDNSSDKPSAVE